MEAIKKHRIIKHPKHSTNAEEEVENQCLPDYFFERTSITNAINSILNDLHTCVIRGPAGVGKSVIARQYAEKYIKNKEFKKVFEINASDDKIEECMSRFAHEMGISNADCNNNPLSLEQSFKGMSS